MSISTRHKVFFTPLNILIRTLALLCMRKIIVEEWLSLDGYAADANGSLDFFTPFVRNSYHNEHRQAMLQSVDTILLGGNTYRQFAALWPARPVENDPLAALINSAQKIVFSHTLTTAPWGTWPEAIIKNGNPADVLNELRLLPGKNMVIWGSISLAQTLMKHNLVDEYYLHVCAVLTGGGRRFFTGGLPPSSLKLVDAGQSSGSSIVDLHYKRNI